jgi:microcystin-dependent protein
MPLETGTYISDLNVSNPAHSDGLSQADAHLRLLKATLLATFPSINGAVNITDEQLNALATSLYGAADGTSVSPSIRFLSELTLGLYKAAAGQLGVAGKLHATGDIDTPGRFLGNGSVDAGAIFTFPKTPTGGMASGGTATGSERYVLGDGSVYNIATFPLLGAFLGSTYGGNGTTTFGTPNFGNRFIRAAGGSVAVGTTQSNAIKSFTAPVAGTAQDHQHSFSGSGTPSLGGTAIPNILTTNATGAPAGALNVGSAIQVGTITVGGVTISGNTGFASASLGGAQTISGTATYTGDTETRPDSFAAYICLKT